MTPGEAATMLSHLGLISPLAPANVKIVRHGRESISLTKASSWVHLQQG
ncbi:hypothetical protein [Bradyrhizobium archetypum]|uniref:Uncharacterized protein n=1 Tax=Bradyrhizobium archetypum TaxID=2721160 RepID=A0A7Y4H9K4_9BRAD|nr:hypothetical protein [Bradyrhizobium archetypum]NOJ50185.1 hypothetical protein [Bradyrhizobium archetypum]